MKKIIPLFILCFLLLGQVASAHVANEDKLYTDVNASTTNAQQILIVNSIGLIGYTGDISTLSQYDNLTRKELAAWMAVFFGLSGSTYEELANASLQEENISSLEGDVTYEDINIALFHRTLKLDNPDETLTKAKYVDLIYNNLETDMGGHTLLQMGGFIEGPTGVIEDVVVDDHATTLEIAGTSYTLSGHPRVSAETIEATDWIGQTIELSYFTSATQHSHSHDEQENSGEATLQYVQLKKSEEAEESSEKVVSDEVKSGSGKISTEEVSIESAAKETQEEANDSQSKLIVPAIILVIILAVGGIFIWKRKVAK